LKKSPYITLLLFCVFGTLVLKAQPVANFTSNKTAGCSPLTVQFTSTSSGAGLSYDWAFGNGNNSTLPVPSATYVNPGTYTVSLKVTNGTGTNTKTVTAYITVYPNPTIIFSATPLSGCAPLTTSFTDNSSSAAAITNWQWDFGNGNTSTQKNPGNTYSTVGSFQVSVIVTDANGCQSTQTKPAYISTSASFTADFTAVGNVSCTLPAQASFSPVISPAGTYSYDWDFGDGSTHSNLPNPSPHTYSVSGNYTVTMVVTATNGCKKTITKTNFVQAANLNAAFTFTSSSNCAPSIVNLTNTSGPDLSSLIFGWKLNGGQPKSTTNTNYILNNAGDNEIILVAKNSAGCLDTMKQTITLNARPTALFVADKYVFCDVPATVNFTDNSTGGVTSWSWNFGNNVSNTTQNPSITYNFPGTYQVRLIASKGGSCSDTNYVTIKVSKPSVVIQRQNQKKGCAPLTEFFQYNDLSVVPLTTWKWELGGVTLSTGPSFNHTFPDTGIFILKLTGTNAEGCTWVGYDTVKVGMKPGFNFTADKFSGCYNKTSIRFTFQNFGVVPDKFEWEFGKESGGAGMTSNLRDPLIAFNDTGLYYVKLVVSHYGCSTELEKPDYITIYPPIARFTYTIDNCATDTVAFLNVSAGKNKYVWRFGDNQTSTASDPVHNYINPGAVDVWLIATDTVSNCMDSTQRRITIIKPPQVLFGPLDTAVCSGATVKFRDLSIVDASRIIKFWDYKVTNGVASGAKNPNLTFPLAGTYGVTLTITDDKGCKYKLIDSPTVKVYGGNAMMSMDKTGGCTPFALQVSDLSVTENPIVSRKWLWGDGDSNITPAVNYAHLYSKPAINQNAGLTLKLIVTDDKGCEFTTYNNIKPTRPLPNYNVKIKKICGTDSVFLTAPVNDTTVFNPATFKWSLPTGFSTFQNIKMAMQGDSTYDIQLRMTDGNGCVDSVTKSIKIDTRPPIIGLDAAPRTVTCYLTHDEITFKDTSIRGGSGLATWSWTFGDNTTSANPTSKKYYLKPGKYPVSLAITDSAGCKDSLRIPDFIIVGGPYGSYTFNPRRGCNPVKVFFEIVSPNAKYSVWDHADGNVDTIRTDTHSYEYTNPGVYYPRLTLQDSSETCSFGYDAIDSIVVFPLPQPDFTSDRIVICKNTGALFSNTTPAHPYFINAWKWKFGTGDSSMLEGPFSYVFTVPGVYPVQLEATDVNGCYNKIIKDSFITVNDDTIPPAIPLVKRATVEDNESVLFEYLPNAEVDFAKYIIYTDMGQYVKNNIIDTSLLEISLNTLTTPYNYKLVAVDVCNNQSLLSEQHTTVELKAEGGINTIELNWTPYTGFDTSKLYEIWRKTPDESSFSQLITVHGDSLHYTDTSILCHQEYFYRIKTVETDSMMHQSWSDTSGAKPIYIPVLPVPENIRATVQDNRYVRLEWHMAKHNRVFTYHIYRSVDDGEAVFYKSLVATDTVLVDQEVDVQEHSYTYTTFVVDACGGQSSPSNTSKSILLKVHMVGNDILTHDPELIWNAYSKWSNGVDHYNVEFYYDSSGTFDLVARNEENELTQRHRYVNLVQSDYCYLVTAFKRGDTALISESNLSCVSTEPRLYAPNVFTINNDGLNDVFYVRGVFIDRFSLKIFDRWGERVFETHDLNTGWNGTFQGQACKPDVFVYLAEGIGKKGQRIAISGNVTLLR
jgi:gliding motility-associated-like protein